MNELKKILIQHILETQDERLLKMLWDIVKLNQEPTGFQNIVEPDFSSHSNLDASEIQHSIDSFFNAQPSKNDNF
jgi:hypothetical protein